MNPNHLLDAIGQLDDRHFETGKSVQIAPVRRRLVALIAAVLMIMLSVGTAMAVSPEFRKLMFSIFHLETQEQPPAGTTITQPVEEGPAPTQSGLQELDVVTIDGVVRAHYFTSEGLVLTCEGGFYTCSRSDLNAVPEDGAFWELRADGIAEVKSERIDFPLTYGNRTFRITFDHAILNEKLNIKVWPRGVNEDPVGNGWNVQPIGNRTDIALMSVPVRTETDYTHDFLLLDLASMETTDLLEGIHRDNLIVDGCWVTEDLHYALLVGTDRDSGSYGYWFCDLEKYTITSLNTLVDRDVAAAYFLDDSTLIFREPLGQGAFHVVRYHIPTGEQDAIVENTTMHTANEPGYRGVQKTGGNGVHGLLFRENGTVDLINLRDNTVLQMTGLDSEKLTTSESPDGTRIMIAYEETNDRGELGYGFSSLGILNPETGVLQMLSRSISGNPENFWGWLDNETVAVTAHDASGGYYVYVYQFSE